MTRWGYTMMCEQSDPRQLVSDVVRAEEVGFEFSVISDHYFPWLDSQGHSPYAWSVLGAAAHATSSIRLMTYVTCPSFRYHPAVVAQKAATVQILSEGRFTLGLGTGENLNEHVVGQGWPPVRIRHERLEEAVQIIRALFTERYVNFEGRHFQVDRARLWDRPDEAPPIGIAASGESSVTMAANLGDALIAVDASSELCKMFDRAGGKGKPRIGQVAISYDPDADEAQRRAHDQFRWFASGWKVMSELPTTVAFKAASEYVTPEDVREQIPCGPNVEEHVDKIRKFVDAGFTDVALIQIGGAYQEGFFRWAADELLPALRSL